MFRQSKATEVHYRHPWDLGSPRCGIRHGKKITLTSDKSLVTCNLCKYHLGVPKSEIFKPRESQDSGVQLTLFGT